ncbi:MAG: asparagine synthase (glutamine-hydrolyzing) [Parcubacteria group bacterium]|nr:asparagine synthase (glutamine-hydrolyzing) [Parcubacteria group bacterium]
MCGIVGIFDARQRSFLEESVLSRMAECLSHRGPDDRGVFVSQEHGIGLGHTRLAIIDLSSLGHQPMANKTKTLWIAFNGEIYNFQEVRSELEKRGRKFKSASDTEVILEAYEEWGMESVARFRGMFAFAIWDANSGKLILCRDRAGVKPLYYYQKNGLLLFASELKALHKHPEFKKEINYEALALFLQLGYIPAPHTIFQNTFKLQPGSYLEIDTHGNSKEVRYWDIASFYQLGPFQKSEEEIIEELEGILLESFRYRMVADVPVGIFLSGGLDSSTIAALLQKQAGAPIKTFTIGFHEKGYDEAPFAKKIAQYFGTEHHELYCTKEMAADVIPQLPDMYDEPFGDSSAIPTHLVSKFAREQVKVVLSGDGGDELFGGYPKYGALEWYQRKFGALPPALSRSLAVGLALFSPSLKKHTNLKNKVYKLRNLLRERSFEDIFRTANSFWTRQQLLQLLRFPFDANSSFYGFNELGSLDAFAKMQVADFRVYLPDDILVKADRATMAVGLEGREPFLDQKIAEYVARVPSSIKFKKGQSKYLLKKILARYIPEELIERPKQGFGIPIHAWLRQDFSRFLQEYLAPERLLLHGLFDQRAVQRALKRHREGRGVDAHKLWFLLMFQMWYERWMTPR